MTREEEALLAAVIANPHDDVPRAVYADHLIDRGDPLGTFIALQLALARTEAGAKRDAIAAEAAALEQQHRATWSREVAQHTLKHHYHRGFVYAIETRARAFATHGARLVALAPIQRVRLRTLDAPTLHAIIASGALHDIRALDLTYCLVDPQGLAAILRTAPGLGALGIQAHDGLYEVALEFPRITVMTDGISQGQAAVALRKQKRLVQWKYDYFGADGGVITTT